MVTSLRSKINSREIRLGMVTETLHPVNTLWCSLYGGSQQNASLFCGLVRHGIALSDIRLATGERLCEIVYRSEFAEFKAVFFRSQIT